MHLGMTANIVSTAEAPQQVLEKIRHSNLLALTEAHRYMSYAQKDTYSIAAFCTMVDSVVGDTLSADFIAKNSKVTFSDKQAADVKKVFPKLPLDISHIDIIVYNLVDAVEDLLNSLVGWLSAGAENIKRVIIMLNDLVNTLKKMVLDTMLKVFIHNKIEMMIKTTASSRVA